MDNVPTTPADAFWSDYAALEIRILGCSLWGSEADLYHMPHSESGIIAIPGRSVVQDANDSLKAIARIEKERRAWESAQRVKNPLFKVHNEPNFKKSRLSLLINDTMGDHAPHDLLDTIWGF